MKTHTNTFKANLTMFGKQIDAKITYTLNNEQIVLTNEELNSIQPITQGDLLKSIMKELYVDSNIEIPINTEIQFEFGLFNYNNDEYEYVNFGKYYVTKSEYQEDTRSYLITCYDKMINSMVDYEEVPMIYPTTVRSYINELCETIGLDFANASDTFANYDKEVPTDLYKDLGYTYRGVLDELAQVTASNICINANNELEIRYIIDTNETFDEEYFSEDNVKFGKKIGKINSIVLSRSAESDNVYLRDEESVQQNGLYEIKIIDNQIMNFNNRSEFLPDILQRLDNLEFYSMDVKSTGICYLDICDRYTISVNNNSYTCVLMNDEININQGLEENIYVEEPKVSETEYKYADETDRKINQTTLIVNKQQGQINAVVSQVDEIEQELANPTSIKEGEYFDLEDALDEPLQDFKMYGQTQQDSTPTPSSPQPIHNVSGDNTIEICGKNLFSSELEQGSLNSSGETTSSTTRVRSKDFITINSNTQYTLSFTTTIKQAIIYEYDNNKTFIGQISSSWSNIPYTFTTSLTARYIKVVIRNNNNSTIIPSDITDIMLYKGSTASEYEAYIGNSQLISLGVENLFNINSSYDEANGVTISIDGNVLKQTNTNAYARSGWVINGLEANKKYMLSCNYSNASGSSIQIRAYKSDKSTLLIQTSDVTSTSGIFKLLITPTESSCYLRFYSNTSGTSNNYDVSFSNIQLEKGSKKNSYSPYGASYIELNKISTYQDYIYRQDNRWYLHKEIGKVVLKGGEDESYTLNSSGTESQYYKYIFSNKAYVNNDINIGNYSSHFKSVRNNFAYIRNGTFSISSSGDLMLGDTTHNSTTDFKTWLSTHNTIVYYVLATPTDTEITDTTLLEQLNRLMTLPLYKNMTHITLTPNDLQPAMKIEYYRDTSLNNTFVPKSEMSKYYTKTETIAQIQIGNSSIQQSVAEMQTTLDSTGNAINTISNQVQTLQSSTSQQINVINEQLENGVTKVKTTTGYTFDSNGLGITKGEEFKNLITDRNQQISSNNKEILFMGYDDNLKKTVARIPELESARATIGVHRCETITKNGKKRTAWFYVGGGN